MTYLDKLSKEYDRIRNSVQYQFEKTIVKKSKSRQLAKLRRYIARVRGEHVPKQKWLAKLFEGRPNRTPWKLKTAPYISKADRYGK